MPTESSKDKARKTTLQVTDEMLLSQQKEVDREMREMGGLGETALVRV